MRSGVPVGSERCQLLRELAFDQQFVDAALGDGERFLDVVRQWQHFRGRLLWYRRGSHKFKRYFSEKGSQPQEFVIILDPSILPHENELKQYTKKYKKVLLNSSSGKF